MTPTTAPAFSAQSTLKPLGFDPSKLNGLSEKLIRSHWENNYGGSVKALALVKKQLADSLASKDTPYAHGFSRPPRALLRRPRWRRQPRCSRARRAGRGVRQPRHLGSEFRRMGLGLGGGSGWVMVGYNLHTGQIENYWLWDHLHGPPATLPLLALLVMDMYEHSYQMDFGAATAKYVDAFFQNIRWEAVHARLEQAKTFVRDQS